MAPASESGLAPLAWVRCSTSGPCLELGPEPGDKREVYEQEHAGSEIEQVDLFVGVGEGLSGLVVMDDQLNLTAAA